MDYGEARAALNMAYDPDVIDRLDDKGHAVAEFDAEYDELDAAIGRALAETPAATVLYHTGGYGIEPIVYVLGPDAEAVAEVVREIV